MTILSKRRMFFFSLLVVTFWGAFARAEETTNNVPSVSTCLSMPDVSACASPTSNTCKALLNTWNDAGCFCDGVETVDISAYASALEGAMLANGIAKHDASTDSVCVQALAEQSSLGAQDVLKAPAYAYAVKTSSTSYPVHWAASEKYKDETVSLYSVTPYIPGADKMPIRYTWPYYGISSTLNSSIAFGGALSTSVDVSDMEQTASSLGSVIVFLVHAVVIDGTGTKTVSPNFASAKYVPVLAGNPIVEMFASATSSDVSTSCGTFTSPCASLAATLASTLFRNAVSKKVSLLPGTFASSSCGLSITSLGPVEISSLTGLPDSTTIDCGYENHFATISGDDDAVTISGVTIQNGRSETGGGLKIANSATSERVQLSDVVVKDSLAENLGGGIHVVSASPKFDNVVVQNCSGGNDRTGNANRGGGIYIETNSNVIANDLTVKGCSLDVSGKGGGLNVDESSSGVFTNAVIENNSAFFAAGIFIGNNCKPKFINAKVSGNSASYGSGIGIFNGGDAEFVDGTISKNTPTANAESYGGGLLVYSGAKGTFTGVTFTENEADYGAGVMAWPQAILLTFDSCMFTKNVAKVNGGAINAKTASTIVTSAQTTLAGNVAQNLGGAIHAEPSASVTLSSETTVYKNTAKNGGGVSCVGADITINSASKFVENVASSYGGGVYLESSCKTTVTAAVFSGNTAGGSNETVCPRVRGAGGGAFAVVGVYDVSSVSQGATNLEVSQNTVMTKNAAIDGGAIFVLSSSDAATTSSTSGSTPSVSLYSEGAIVTVREGATLLENTAFGCHGPGEKRGAGGGIYASVGIVTAKDAIFSKNVAATHGGGIRAVDNVASLKLDATTMAENVASDGFGGAIASSAIAFRVENGSVMSKNEATNGGAISIAPPSEESGADSALDFELASLTLDSNVASKVGGGVYFDANFAKASITPTTMNTLSQLIFRSNVAESGPSVYWTRASSPNVEFTCESCSNLPTFHPEDYATEALKVQAPAHVLAELSKGVGSGEVAKSFSVELVDYYGHVAVSEPASSTCTISTASHELDDIAITDYAGDLGRLEFLKNHSPLVVSGELSENSQKGVSTFDKVTFRGELGDVYRVSFLCKRENDVQIGDELILNAQILNCLPGYQPNWTNLENGEKSARICSYCEDRTFNLDGIQCKPCPEGGDCRGGSDISSLEGWWRSNDLSEYIFQCPMGAEACKATNSTGNVACEDAYEGPVCALCKEGFRKLGGKCLKCQSKPITDAIPVIGILALIGFIIYIFKKPLQEAAGTVLATCVIYVFQTLGLLYSYDVKWPSPMKRTLGILDVTNLNLDALAPGCSNASNTFYVSYIGALTVPPIILMLTFVAFNTAGVIRKMNRNTFLGLNINDEKLIEFQGKCKRNCVWMLVLTYAGVTKTVLQLFNSRTLDVGTFLRVDYKIEAEGATFNAYRSSAYLAMIIYPFGLPLFLAWKLLKRRPTGKLSESDSLRSTYGFMYKSNRPGCEGWELVLLATKFFLAAIPVFATERNLRGDPNSGYDVSSEFASACQIAMAQMLCGVAFCLALYVKPYAQPLHNRQFSLAIGTVISWLAVTTAVFANPQAFTNTESSGVGAGLVIFSLVTLAYAISASAKAGEKPFAREKKDPDEPSFWKSQSMFLKSFKRIDVQTTQKGTSTTEDNDEKASSLKPLAAEAA